MLAVNVQNSVCETEVEARLICVRPDHSLTLELKTSALLVGLRKHNPPVRVALRQRGKCRRVPLDAATVSVVTCLLSGGIQGFQPFKTCKTLLLTQMARDHGQAVFRALGFRATRTPP